MSDLSPLFTMDRCWECPMADMQLMDHDGNFYHSVYECRRCGALVKDPELHFAWHGLVDSNQAVVDP